jgi:hypothetical protein
VAIVAIVAGSGVALYAERSVIHSGLASFLRLEAGWVVAAFAAECVSMAGLARLQQIMVRAAGTRLAFDSLMVGKLCERAGIGGGWIPHETRHTWVSVLSDAGVDTEDIADAAGHVNSSVTRNVYRRQISEELAKAASAMDRIFGEVSGS